MIANSSRLSYEERSETPSYRVRMVLTIAHFRKTDVGRYDCRCRNELGEAEGTIKLHGIVRFIRLHTYTASNPRVALCLTFRFETALHDDDHHAGANLHPRRQRYIPARRAHHPASDAHASCTKRPRLSGVRRPNGQRPRSGRDASSQHTRATTAFASDDATPTRSDF